MLGHPTGCSIAANVIADAGTAFYFEYGTAPATYSGQTLVETAAGGPVVIEFTGLRPNTRYHYRARYRPRSETKFLADVEHSFQTQRSPGSTFSFGVQGDSHPEREGKMFHPGLYAQNMRNAAAEQPDFYIGLGDDFSIERLIDKGPLTQEAVDEIDRNQRTFFGILGNGTAVFLANGNHEQAAGDLLTDRYVTAYRDAPVFAGKARVTSFALPSSVTVSYIRAVLPGDESKAGAANGATALSYTLPVR